MNDFIAIQVSENTKKNYKLVLSRFIKNYPELPTGTKWVKDYINLLVNSGLSNTTVNYHMTIISKFLEYTTGKKVEFDRLKEKRREVDFLTDEEVELIIKNSTAEFLPVILFMLDTGCRVGELESVSKLEFTTVPSEVLILGKGNKQRYLQISERTMSFLKHGKIFGREWTVRSVQYWLKKIAGRSGIQKNIHPHMLRHTMATKMLWNGADIKDIQNILGHQYLATTEIYTHVTPERVREVWNDYFKKRDSAS